MGALLPFLLFFHEFNKTKTQEETLNNQALDIF
jgi:hypothetical protein